MQYSNELEVVAEEEEEEEHQDVSPSRFMMLLPLCEANRSIVAYPTVYAANVAFNVGALKLIDKAP